jgi:hypothetical protein
VAEILEHVLFADQSDRHDSSIAVGDGLAEQRFEHENAFGMMPQRAVARVSDDRLGLVEPVVKRPVVVDAPTPALHR